MKTILITGASGFLGHHLVKYFLDNTQYNIYAILGRPEDRANSFPISDRVQIFPCNELFSTEFGHIDTIIHTAFSRGENLPGLTSSIEFTANLIEMINEQNVDSIINISSQGTYKSLKYGEKVSESGTIEPKTTYGLAKWAVENLLRVGCKKQFTSIRMASLSSNARFLDFFVESVISGKPIKVTAPHQYASIMDISDAVNGIAAVENISLEQREQVYNLGPETEYSILDFANITNLIGKNYGLSPVQIEIEDKGPNTAICMDCNKLKRATKWQPSVTIEKTISNLFEKKLCNK